MKLLNRLFVPALLAAAALTGPARGETYPARPIKIIVPYTPGGFNDTLARTVGAKLQEKWGQPVTVDNRPGGGTVIGTDAAAKAPPDGYTLFVTPFAFAVNQSIFKKLPYDPEKDFAPITLAATTPNLLVVSPSLGVNSVKELIALAKSKPGQLLFASSGNAGTPHLCFELLNSVANIKLVHVPYKGGGPQVIALLAGESQASLATVASVIVHIKSGRLRAIGVTATQRTNALPQVPAIAETVPGYEMSPWIGVFAPAGTPKPVIDKLNAEINKALKLPEVAQTLSAQALDPWTSTPEEFAARLKTDYDKYAQLIKLTGAKID